MRIRRNVLSVSSVLLTVALLSIVPPELWNAWPSEPTTLNACWRALSKLDHQFAVASLATISITLIVIWTGYVKGLRSAWIVMFIFVWVWAFPLTIFPYLQALQYNALNLSGWLPDAVKQSGFARSFAEMIVTFSLMVVGLFLPIKAFFWNKKTGEGPALPPK